MPIQHELDARAAKNVYARDDKINPPIPSKRQVKIIATFRVNEVDLNDLAIYEIFKERLPEILNRNLIDIRVEKI